MLLRFCRYIYRVKGNPGYPQNLIIPHVFTGTPWVIMKIADVWNDENERPTLSFELSAPKNDKQAEALRTTIDEFIALEPAFFGVTFGAGGSTRDGSHELVKHLREKDQNVIAYIAPYGMPPAEVSDVLNKYKELGVSHVLAVRGDKPRDENFETHPDAFPYASNLIDYINKEHDFNIGTAGYPEGHTNAESKEKDIEILKQKVDNGAEFIICQYFYDNEYFFDFRKRCRDAGISVPIVPGIMPIYSVKLMEILAGVCGATITERIRSDLAALPEGDKDALQAWGVDFGARQCKALLEAGVPGLHFFTLNKRTTSMKIINKLKEDGVL